MTTQSQFKDRFNQVLKDLQEEGINDPEAMFLLGSLAADLAGNLNRTTWSGAKAAMGAETYRMLLKTCETQGNEHLAEGRVKHAYAVQALAVSLVARTQHFDPDMKTLDGFLDHLIDTAIAVYRDQPQRAVN